MFSTLYAAVKILLVEDDSATPSLRENFKEIETYLNDIFQPCLASPFILREETVQGLLLLQESPKFLEIIQLVDLEMDPLLLRYALGIGNITSELGAGGAWSGSAVRAVDRALKVAAKGEVDVSVRLLSPFLTRTVNTLFAIESDLRNNWSSAHREAIRLVRLGMTQMEMAKTLGVTQAAISQRLKHARWDRYLQVTEVIKELLSQARWRTILPWDIRKEEKKKTRSK